MPEKDYSNYANLGRPILKEGSTIPMGWGPGLHKQEVAI